MNKLVKYCVSYLLINMAITGLLAALFEDNIPKRMFFGFIGILSLLIVRRLWKSREQIRAQK